MHLFLKRSVLLPLALFWGGFFAQTLWAQTLTTVAGGGAGNYTGDGGPATQASLIGPMGGPDDVAVDSTGNYYIADAGNCTVRMVNIATGIITTVAGVNGNCGYTGDGGPATSGTLNYPTGVALDPQNNLYIADYYNNVIREVFAASGAITTVIGNNSGIGGYSGDGGLASLAEINNPQRIRFDAQGDLYIADSSNAVVRVVSAATGDISTFAGNGTIGYSGDGGPATSAELNAPQAIAFDSAGNVFISDPGVSVVRKVAVGTGVITTYAGNGTIGYSGDGGPTTLAGISEDSPDGLVVGCGDNLFLTDDEAYRVRMVSPAAPNTITTIAGNGIDGSTTSGPALSAELAHPESLALDHAGNLILVNYFSGLVQLISGACPPTPTATNSPTVTPTTTPTLSPTNSPTMTPSNSPTDSPTITPTYTPTNSPTITPTDSPTDSPTITPTPSPSNTATNSPTVTPSNTPTRTPTVTPTSTPTNSPTNSPTQTPTPTPTFGITLSKQVNPNSASSGTTLTYDLAVTVTGGAFNGVVVTDTLPSAVSFVAVGTPSAGTATFNAANSLLTWNLPPSLPPGSYGLAYETLVKPFVAGGTQVVNGAKLTYTGLASPLTAAAAVSITGDYTVKVGVYNEAGELVKSLWVAQYSQPINSFTLQGTAITALTGPNGVIDVYTQGYLLGVWDGTGTNGNPVSNGVYLIKIDNVDAFGGVTTITQQATVSRALAKVSVDIYNAAGEVVKHLYATTSDPTSAVMNDVVLSSQVLAPGAAGANGGPATVLITVQGSSSPVALSWDGTNDAGAYVSDGHYLIAIRWVNGQGGETDISKGVLVTGGNRFDQKVTAWPNILKPSEGQSTVTFQYFSAQAYTLKVRLYDIAGERTGSVEGPPSTNQASWDVTGLASGLYLAVVDLVDAGGGTAGRQTVKIVILR